jgi:hypothetical protein
VDAAAGAPENPRGIRQKGETFLLGGVGGGCWLFGVVAVILEDLYGMVVILDGQGKCWIMGWVAGLLVCLYDRYTWLLLGWFRPTTAFNGVDVRVFRGCFISSVIPLLDSGLGNRLYGGSTSCSGQGRYFT